MPTSTGFSGIDVRASLLGGASALVCAASLKNSSGAQVTSGTIRLRIFKVMSDGTLRQYDFSTNAFLSSASSSPTTGYVAMTQRTIGDSSFTNTGLWTYALTTLTGFTVGGVYIFDVSDESGTPTAFPPQQERQFQFGQAEGDVGAALSLNTAGTPAMWSVAGSDDIESASDTLNLLAEVLSGTELMVIVGFGNLVPDVTGIYADNSADPGVGGNLTRLDGAYYISGGYIIRTSDNTNQFQLPYFTNNQSQVAAIYGGGTGSGLAFSVAAAGQAGGVAILANNGSVQVDVANALLGYDAPTVGDLPAVDAISGTNYARVTLYGFFGALVANTSSAWTKIAAAFVNFFNAASPTGTINSLPAAVPGATGGVAIQAAGGSVKSDATAALTAAAGGAIPSVAQIAAALPTNTTIQTAAAAALTAAGIPAATVAAAIVALEAAGILQQVPGQSSSSGQSEEPLQFTAQALANASGGTTNNITSETITIQS